MLRFHAQFEIIIQIFSFFLSILFLSPWKEKKNSNKGMVAQVAQFGAPHA